MKRREVSEKSGFAGSSESTNSMLLKKLLGVFCGILCELLLPKERLESLR